MSKKKKKSYDPGIAIRSADAFFNHAEPFLRQIGTDMNSAHVNAMGDLGGFVASATNLALSTELYLKSLWMMLGYPVPEHHKLWPLYKRLPSVRIKEEILSSYDRQNQMFGEEVSALELAISKGPADERALKKESQEAEKRNRDNSLAGVLRRSSDSFIVWRYLHEQADDNGVRIIGYEFSRIRLIASCARTSAVDLSQRIKNGHSE